MTETVLGLMRHGQTDWNVALRLQGSSDIALNPEGLRQAELASKKIHPADWDIIIASPLSRAHKTAEIIASQTGHDVVIVPDLIERSFGEAEGLSHPQWRALHESGKPILGLETMDELRIRAKSLLSLVATHYDGKRVLAVSHGAYIRMVLQLASEGKYPTSEDRLGNVSLSSLIYQDGLWSVLDFNPKSLAD